MVSRSQLIHCLMHPDMDRREKTRNGEAIASFYLSYRVHTVMALGAYFWKCFQNCYNPLPNLIDDFQMSIKHHTSGGQMRNQEAAVQWTFHLERSSFYYHSALMVRTQCKAYSCTKHRPRHLPSGSEANAPRNYHLYPGNTRPYTLLSF